MQYCPNCRIEYEDWPTECGDCKVPLVKELIPEGTITGDPANTAPEWTGGKVPVYETDNIHDLHGVLDELAAAGIQTSVFERKGWRGHQVKSRVIIVQKEQAVEARRILDQILE